MKKTLLFSVCTLLAWSIVLGGASPCAATAQKNCPTLISEQRGCVTGEGEQIVTLYGTYPDKGLFAQDIRIVVTQAESGETVAEISPAENAGYLPAVLLADFTGDGTKEIFLGIDSGGSGGFGFAYIYELSGGTAKEIFDFAKVPMPYTAQYADGYRLTVSDNSAALMYSIDIRGRGEVYLGALYAEDGTLKAPVQADVSAVNTVLPFFMNTANRFHLLVMRRVTGLYNADAFGYTQDFMRWDGTQFITYFRLFGIYCKGKIRTTPLAASFWHLFAHLPCNTSV